MPPDAASGAADMLRETAQTAVEKVSSYWIRVGAYFGLPTFLLCVIGYWGKQGVSAAWEQAVLPLVTSAVEHMHNADKSSAQTAASIVSLAKSVETLVSEQQRQGRHIDRVFSQMGIKEEEAKADDKQ